MKFFSYIKIETFFPFHFSYDGKKLFKSWIKLIYDTVDICHFVINEFNPTFKVQNMETEAFQNALFGNATRVTVASGQSDDPESWLK